MHLGFGLQLGGLEQLSANHVGGGKGIGLRQDHGVDAVDAQQGLEPLHDAHAVLRREPAAAERLDAGVDV